MAEKQFLMEELVKSTAEKLNRLDAGEVVTLNKCKVWTEHHKGKPQFTQVIAILDMQRNPKFLRRWLKISAPTQAAANVDLLALLQSFEFNLAGRVDLICGEILEGGPEEIVLYFVSTEPHNQQYWKFVINKL